MTGRRGGGRVRLGPACPPTPSFVPHFFFLYFFFFFLLIVLSFSCQSAEADAQQQGTGGACEQGQVKQGGEWVYEEKKKYRAQQPAVCQPLRACSARPRQHTPTGTLRESVSGPLHLQPCAQQPSAARAVAGAPATPPHLSFNTNAAPPATTDTSAAGPASRTAAPPSLPPSHHHL